MKLAAIDLDGTLLNSQHQLLEANTKAIQQLVAQGGKVAIATGRTVHSAAEMVGAMGIDAYILALNGTYLAEKRNGELRELAKFRLDNQRVWQALALAAEVGITFIASNDKRNDRVHFEEQSELVQEFLRSRPDLFTLSLEEMRQKLEDDSTEILKVAFTNDDRQKLLDLQQKLKQVGIKTIFSDTNYIEYLPENVNKGSGLKFLCEHLKLNLSQVMAIGDQENDIEMLTESGIGVAMGNAQSHVKAVANYVTTSNDEAGVAQALKDYFR